MTLVSGVAATPVTPTPVNRAEQDKRDASEGFERVLVEQLTGAMLGSMGSGPYKSLIAPTIADAIVAGGGLGLAGSISPPDSPSTPESPSSTESPS